MRTLAGGITLVLLLPGCELASETTTAFDGNLSTSTIPWTTPYPRGVCGTAPLTDGLDGGEPGPAGAPIDVLWVLDNSASMTNEKDALFAALPTFVETVVASGRDFHIGVTTTDINSWPNVKGVLETGGTPYSCVDGNTPDPVAVLTAMFVASIPPWWGWGSANPRGLGATWYALEINRDTTSAGFLRDEAEIHTIVVSDEADDTPSWAAPEEGFVDWYEGLDEGTQIRSFSSLVTPDRGTAYLDVTDQVGGVALDLADDGCGSGSHEDRLACSYEDLMSELVRHIVGVVEPHP